MKMVEKEAVLFLTLIAIIMIVVTSIDMFQYGFEIIHLFYLFMAIGIIVINFDLWRTKRIW